MVTNPTASPGHPVPQTARGRGPWGPTLALGEEPQCGTQEASAGWAFRRGQGTLKQTETSPKEAAAEADRARAECGGREGGGRR